MNGVTRGRKRSENVILPYTSLPVWLIHHPPVTEITSDMSIGFLEAGLLDLDKSDVSKMYVPIIGLSSTFQNGGVTDRYWM